MFKPERFATDLLLLDKLAEGGMAQVFRALQTGVGGFQKTVAVKRILPEYAEMEEFQQMFLRETQLCAVLQHPNVVQVFNNGMYEGYLYLVMEFVDGKTLADVQELAEKKGVVIPIALACYLIEEAAKGLGYAHELRDEGTGELLSIVHRDMSPHNIMVGYNGTVKIVDFGIAKAAKSVDLTQAGIIKGKEAYLAPEQVAGHPASNLTDLFALGIVCYELITGKYLFDGATTLETLRTIEACEIPRLIHASEPVDEDLEYIVRTALSKDPAARYQSTLEFARDLAAYRSRRFPHFHSLDAREFLHTLFAEQIDKERQKREQIKSQIQGFVDNPDESFVNMSGRHQAMGTGQFESINARGASNTRIDGRGNTINVSVMLDEGDDSTSVRKEATGVLRYRDRSLKAIIGLIVASGLSYGIVLLLTTVFKIFFSMSPIEVWHAAALRQGIFAPETFIFRKILPHLVAYAILCMTFICLPGLMLGGVFGEAKRLLDFFYNSISYLAVVFFAILFYNLFIFVQYTEYTYLWFAIAGLASVVQLVGIGLLSPTLVTLNRDAFETQFDVIMAEVERAEDITASVVNDLTQTLLSSTPVTDTWMGLWTVGYIGVLGFALAGTLNLSKKWDRVLKVFFIFVLLLIAAVGASMIDVQSGLVEKTLIVMTLFQPESAWAVTYTNWGFILATFFIAAVLFGHKKIPNENNRGVTGTSRIKVQVSGVDD